MCRVLHIGSTVSQRGQSSKSAPQIRHRLVSVVHSTRIPSIRVELDSTEILMDVNSSSLTKVPWIAKNESLNTPYTTFDFLVHHPDYWREKYVKTGTADFIRRSLNGVRVRCKNMRPTLSESATRRYRGCIFCPTAFVSDNENHCEVPRCSKTGGTGDEHGNLLAWRYSQDT